MQKHTNTLQKFIMSTNRQAVINAFIERQCYYFHELIDYLTKYRHNFLPLSSSLSNKENQRNLFLSILITFILLTTTFLIICEYRRLLKYIQKYFQWIYSYNQYILLEIRNKFLHKSTPSFLNLLFNSKSHLREKFSNEFIRGLNHEFHNRKVKQKSTFICLLS